MEKHDTDQIWIAAYGVAMAAIVIGNRAGNVAQSVDAMDDGAKQIADRVTKTIEERAALAKTTKGARQ